MALLEALKSIAVDETDCRCSHDDENCCVLQGDVFCPRCIAAVALRAGAGEASESQSDWERLLDLEGRHPRVREAAFLRILARQWRVGHHWDTHETIARCLEGIAARIEKLAGEAIPVTFDSARAYVATLSKEERALLDKALRAQHEREWPIDSIGGRK
jgi:hypothetical protein